MKNSADSARTLYLMHVLTHTTRARLDESLREFDLSSFQYTILSVLEHNPRLSSAGLSRRFAVTPQSMGEVVALLERKGMISRVEDDNNRKVLLLGLTEAGLAATHAGDAVVDELEKSMFGKLTKKEAAQFRETLSKLLSQFRHGQ